MADPRFSVVVPLYDKVDSIAATLRSVLAQTLSPLEVVVIDDGSRDGSGDVVAALGDPRIHLIRQANGGEAAARNAGVAAARGDWIALIDGDDLWYPDHLATLAGVADAFPDVALVSAGSVNQPPGEAMVAREARPVAPRRIDFFRDHRANMLIPSSVAVRRDVYLALGGMRSAPSGADMRFWITLAVDHAMAVSDRTTVVYVVGVGVMAREQAARLAGKAMPPSPVFPAIEQALAGIADPARRAAVTAFGDRTRLQYARSELYAGRPADARRLLAGVVDRRNRAYPAYRLLALLPGRILRLGMTARQWLRR